jgi:hypothetical protein
MHRFEFRYHRTEGREKTGWGSGYFREHGLQGNCILRSWVEKGRCWGAAGNKGRVDLKNSAGEDFRGPGT